MRKQLTTIIFILAQLLLIATPLLAEQASASSPAVGTVFGNVWLDRNGNGIYELNESARANVVVEIKNAAGELIQSTTTDANGNYFFIELEYGEYEIWTTITSGIASSAGTIHVAEVNGANSFNIPLGPEVVDDGHMIMQPVMTSIFLPLINS